MSNSSQNSGSFVSKNHNGSHLQEASTIWTPPVCETEHPPTGNPSVFYSTGEMNRPNTIDYSGSQYPMPPSLFSNPHSSEMLNRSFFSPPAMLQADGIPSPRGLLNLTNPPNLNGLHHAYPSNRPSTSNNENSLSEDGDGVVDLDSNSGGKLKFSILELL